MTYRVFPRAGAGPRALSAVACAAGLMLAACGGGGGDGSASATGSASAGAGQATVAGSGGSSAAAPATGAATKLAVDCADAKLATDAHCVTPSMDNLGTVGAGRSFAGMDRSLSDRMGGGFIEGDMLTLAVEHSSDSDSLGGIWRVNLKTGDRQLISGQTAFEARGSGDSLNRVSDVKRLDASTLVAVVSSLDGAIYSIDEATGNRTMIWSRKTNLRASGDSRCPSDAGSVSSPYAGVDGRFGVVGRTLILSNSNDPDGTGYGLFRYDVDTKTCTAFSQWYKTGEDKVGGGATSPGIAASTLILSGVTVGNGQAYLTSYPRDGLIGFDLTTGKRTLISALARATSDPAHHYVPTGSGDELTYGNVVPLADGSFLVGNTTLPYNYAYVMKVTADGVRSWIKPSSGPASSSVSDDHQTVFEKDGTIYLAMARSILAIDPATGSSMVVSH